MYTTCRFDVILLKIRRVDFGFYDYGAKSGEGEKKEKLLIFREKLSNYGFWEFSDFWTKSQFISKRDDFIEGRLNLNKEIKR